MSILDVALSFMHLGFVRVLRMFRLQRVLRAVRIVRQSKVRPRACRPCLRGLGPGGGGKACTQPPHAAFRPPPPHTHAMPHTFIYMCVCARACTQPTSPRPSTPPPTRTHARTPLQPHQGIKSLFQALVMSLPAFGNVGALIGLFFFMYAYVGVLAFGKVLQENDQARRRGGGRGAGIVHNDIALHCALAVRAPKANDQVRKPWEGGSWGCVQ